MNEAATFFGLLIRRGLKYSFKGDRHLNYAWWVWWTPPRISFERFPLWQDFSIALFESFGLPLSFDCEDKHDRQIVYLSWLKNLLGQKVFCAFASTGILVVKHVKASDFRYHRLCPPSIFSNIAQKVNVSTERREAQPASPLEISRP
jgi:hypothetical protein